MRIKLELKLEKFDTLKVFCQMERACDGDTIHLTLSGLHDDMKDICKREVVEEPNEDCSICKYKMIDQVDGSCLYRFDCGYTHRRFTGEGLPSVCPVCRRKVIVWQINLVECKKNMPFTMKQLSP